MGGGSHLPCWDSNADVADGHNPSLGKVVDLGEALELQHVIICSARCHALALGQDVLVFLLSSVQLERQLAMDFVVEEPGSTGETGGQLPSPVQRNAARGQGCQRWATPVLQPPPRTFFG